MILQRRNGQDRGLSLFIHIDHCFRHDVCAGNPGMAVAAVALPEIGCAFCQILETRSAGKQQSIQTGLLKCFKTSFSSFGHEHSFSPLHDEYVFLLLSILSFGQDQRYERIQKKLPIYFIGSSFVFSCTYCAGFSEPVIFTLCVF